MTGKFVKVFYKNGTDELFELGKKGIYGIGFDPLIIYYEDDGRKGEKIINEDQVLSYDTNAK